LQAIDASKLATSIACKNNKFYVMKNLDLNAMGVVEMDAKEMKEADGGSLLIGFAVLLLFSVAIAAGLYVGKKLCDKTND
jgi:hypothetical protein